MDRIKKAVIPAAGLGTRVLPASKAIPKEMLPIVDKPAIQYIVEEAVNAGIEDILIITSRGKGAIEDHFDKNPELENKLEDSKKEEMLEQVRKLSSLANIAFIRQAEPRGLGHAVLCAKGFVGKEPFAVLYGDDVIISKNTPVTKQLCDAYQKYNKGILGIKKVTKEQVMKGSSLKIELLEKNYYNIVDMIEKPAENKILSLYSILGRCILPC